MGFYLSKKANKTFLMSSNFQLNDSTKFTASLHAIFGQLQSLKERADLQKDSKLEQQYKAARSEIEKAIGHLEGGKKMMAKLDRNLEEMGAKLGKFGREKGRLI